MINAPSEVCGCMAGFADIRAQERVVAWLRLALREHRIPHAYLFTGPQGVGKEATAWALAQALQCVRLEHDACGQCEPCHKVAADIHPDVIVLRVPEGRKRLLIGQVRKLQEGLVYKPFEGRHRVILIPEAELLTEEAANALLKTLEEPPDRTHIVLCSSQPWNLLDTIRSRCHQVRFAPLVRSELSTRLVQEQGLGADEAWVLAGLAEGSTGRALAMMQGELMAERKELLEAVRALSLGKPVALLQVSESWYTERDRVPERLDLLLSWYRDLLLLANGLGSDACIHGDLVDASDSEGLPGLGAGQVLRCLDLLLGAREAITLRNANIRLSLDRLFLGLASEGARA